MSTDQRAEDRQAQDRPIADSVPKGWVEHAPNPLRPYLRLARYDRPIGFWLLGAPGWFGIALANVDATLHASDALIALLIAIGAVAMRGAGCTYNDIIDRDLDAQVARTADRPLPAGTVTLRAAWMFLFAQCAVGLGVLLSLPRPAQLVALLALPLVAGYPFMKRITWFPQAWLGLTFNWAVLVGFTASAGELRAEALVAYAGLAVWTFGYDTIYAHQDREDDAMVGVKSTARFFGSHSRTAVGVSYAIAAALETLHQTCGEVDGHLKEVRTIANEIGAGFMGIGFAPTWSLDEMPLVPKARYGLMRDYMMKVGRVGREMMFRTCTVQVNLDYSSEADMAKKLRVALSLQPVATALFANSPFSDGRPNGWQSLRAQVWSDTDPDRTGMLPCAFEDGFGFERYVDWAIDVPMYFVRRDDIFHSAQGATFRQFMDGKCPAFPGEKPTLGDWEDHLSTLFPEARVKRFIEMRGADAGPWGRICALPAFWVGLLYDSDALDAAWDLAKDWTDAERDALRLLAPKLGLGTPLRNGTLQDIARQAVDISTAGLARRNQRNLHGEDETLFLNELRDIADTGRTPAERLLELWRTQWGGDVSQAFKACAY